MNAVQPAAAAVAQPSLEVVATGAGAAGSTSYTYTYNPKSWGDRSSWVNGLVYSVSTNCDDVKMGQPCLNPAGMFFGILFILGVVFGFFAIFLCCMFQEEDGEEAKSMGGDNGGEAAATDGGGD